MTRNNPSLTRSLLPAATAAAILLLAAAVPAVAGSYAIDPVHSSAVFQAKHFGVSNFYGVFTEMSGTIVYDPEKPEASSIEIEIAADSVDTRNEKRDDHLKSPDFLNAAQFPVISFKSTKVEPIGDDKFEVTGTLTLHGVSREITVTAEKTGQGKHPQSGKELVGFETRFTVDRTEHDMSFMAGPISEDVGFILAVEAGKK